MQKDLLENIFIYKKTAALLATFQMGLFRCIKEYGRINKGMFNQLGFNEDYAELLCVYLANEGYLTKSDGCFRLSKDFEIQLDTFEKICEHESFLYNKWLSLEQIVSSIRIDKGRLFDKDGFTIEEQAVYDNTMYGSNINLITFYILRKIKHKKESTMKCLEFGRSGGRIGQALKKHISKVSFDIVALNHNIESHSLYDLIFIYNTIHYQNNESWKNTFCQMKNMLYEKGVICVADIFYKENNAFSSTILLDWITHGGINNIYSHEVVEQLKRSGFTKIEHQFIDQISTDIIFAYK